MTHMIVLMIELIKQGLLNKADSIMVK